MATSILSSPLPLLLMISLLSLALPLTLHASSLNPFTAGAATVRYWNRKIPNNGPHPDFFLSLLSPLPASLSSSLPSPLSITPDLCRSARLLCPNSTFFEPPSSTIPDNNIRLMYTNEFHKDDKMYIYTSEFHKDDKKYIYTSEFHKDDKKYIYTSKFHKDDKKYIYTTEFHKDDKKYIYTTEFHQDDKMYNYMSEFHKNNIMYIYTSEFHKDDKMYNYMSEFHKNDKMYNYMSDFYKNDKMYIYMSKFDNNDNFEPGIFFREGELKEGNMMPMSDVRNKKPVRSFLPRSIAERIPFEAEAIKSVFALEPDTALADIVDKTVARCQMPPSPGETKRCFTSAEDMIDFAVDMLGDDIVMRSTKSSNGSGGPIMIGKVNKINGGKVTRSISCHQHLFPYMVYHCHIVPKIRVYEVEILSVETKEKINTGVAICHLDTSMWNPKHLAFVQAGGKPGETEVCHWISNGDLAWVVADHDQNDQYVTSY